MAQDEYMPIRNWDHVEFYVGNAKQAAHYYATTFGFALTAYAGLETGVRDRASYVLEQGKIRLVFTSALAADSPIAAHAMRHGDGVKDIALEVPDATKAYEQALAAGARSAMEPTTSEDKFGQVRRSAIYTYGETIHTFVERMDYAGAFLPGYRAVETSGAD
ncbi:MAG: VOC family protein, partial [Chloroflexota bacterium]|nr:VOC family protein [Chloroflexota bacterium]